MFSIGLAEIAVIALAAVVLFGPDRLPELAKQAGQMVRQLRGLARQAQGTLREELGPEYADLKLTDLDPRTAIRKHIIEPALAEDDEEVPVARGILPPGGRPPFDVEAT